MPDQTIDIEIGSRIKHMRTTQKLTQSHLAERIGVTHQLVQRYESGKIRLSVWRLVQISDALSVPVTDFFTTARPTADKTPWSDYPKRMAGIVSPEPTSREKD